MQRLVTTGNATIIAYDNKPLLVTDPWIGDEEPAYFGSWVLSHKIPSELKDDISRCQYVWFSHGHPDHLNPSSLERYRGKKILLPDHVGGRIFKDLTPGGYDVTVLPDREWVQLSDNVRIHCITTRIQDGILLIDICGKLFINLNDAGTRDASRYIRSISRHYEHVYVMALSGYGDADMINFFNEDGSFVVPRAARKPVVGRQLGNLAKATGAHTVIPFSSFHQYQREDSIWAQNYTTPMSAFIEGLPSEVNYVAPFSSFDCQTLAVDTYKAEEHRVTPKPAAVFGDNWSDQLDKGDVAAITAYFARKDRLQNYLGFVNFRVGGRDTTIGMRGPKHRGVTFEVPRGSLMTSINYRIFDDLLIGNFMKTTLHGTKSLSDGAGNFSHLVGKYADNGLAETESEIRSYLAEYRRRAGIDYIVSELEDKSRNFLMRFAQQDSKIYKLAKSIYISYVR